ERAEPGGEVVLHPEAAGEVDLAGRVATLEQGRDGCLRALLRGHVSRPEMQRESHFGQPKVSRSAPSDPAFTLLRMASRPSRIDLLELDIDLRLADPWRGGPGPP